MGLEPLDVLEERDDDFRTEVADLLHSDNWRYVVKPTLLKRCEEIKGRLAKDRRLTIEEVRALQTKYEVLSEIVEEPVRFFLNE